MALVLQEVALRKAGPSLSMHIQAGQGLCVVGQAASGKTRLLRLISGPDAPTSGTIERPSTVAVPEPCNRKVRPQDLSHRKGANRAVLSTEVLSHLGLWEVRQKPISELAPAQIAACDLVDTFMSGAEMLVLDRHLDHLDAWVRREAIGLLRQRCADGALAVVATEDLDLANQFDYLIVLRDLRPLYAGAVADLVRTRGQRQMTIESERSVGTRALVDPLLVEVVRTEGGYKLTPGPGQEHAARMLREGYGDVKYVVSDERSLPEIILEMR